MFDWIKIGETVIAGLIVFVLSGIGTLVVKKVILPSIFKKGESSESKSSFKQEYLNPFGVSLFLTFFFILAMFVSLFLQWSVNITMATGLIASILIFVTYFVYDSQCPRCNRLFSKHLITKEKISDEKRPYRYRNETITLYSDGSEKDRKFTGKEKVRMETIRTEKEHYVCRSCNHEWNKLFVRNLDKHNRPKPNIKRTKIKPPRDTYYY